MLASLAREAVERGLHLDADEQPLDPAPTTEELAFANVLYSIRDGQGIKAIAQAHGVSRGAMMLWLVHADGKLSEEGRDARKQAMSRAREESAAALEDDVLDIADSADSETASVARIRMGARQWLASVRDPARYGKSSGTTVHISMGQLHLHALRELAAEPGKQALSSPAPQMLPSSSQNETLVSDYEVMS